MTLSPKDGTGSLKKTSAIIINNYSSAMASGIFNHLKLVLCRSVKIWLDMKPVRGGNKVGDRWHIVFLTVFVCCNEIFNLCHLTRWLQHVLKNRLLFYGKLVSVCVWRCCCWDTSVPAQELMHVIYEREWFTTVVCVDSMHRQSVVLYVCFSICCE